MGARPSRQGDPRRRRALGAAGATRRGQPGAARLPRHAVSDHDPRMTMTMTIAEATAALTAPGQPFEMDEVAIRGIPTRVWKHAPVTLRSILETSAGFGDATFLV